MHRFSALFRSLRRGLVAALFPLVAATAAPASADEITGVVTAVGAAGAPAGATLHLQLLDVTDPDGAARVVSEITFGPVSLIDIPFRLPYDPSAISPERAYAVSGRVIRDSKTLYASNSDTPVLTRGAPSDVRITMLPKGAPTAQTGGLKGVAWAVQRYGDGQAPEGAAPTMTFYDDDSVGGSTACNTWRGGFSQEGAKLRFGMALQTQMACEEPAMTAEHRFLSQLPAVRSHRLEGGALTLLDESGAVVMELAHKN